MPILKLSLVYPMFALFVLSVIVLCKMFLTRVSAVRTGKIRLDYFKYYSQGGEPEEIIKTSRHFSNLFEAPVLFYVVCILGMIIPVESPLFVVLAWIYVFFRFVHAYIHIGTNKLKHRMRAYAFGWLTLSSLWIFVVVRVLSL